jgi:hypothetical protein
MVLRTKIPDSCADLCPAKVERTLEKHFGNIYAAARELGVPGPDLKRLTWAQPDLYKNALEDLELVVQRAVGELIRALYSDDPRRREWASEKILSSYMARGHPFSPAPRREARGAEASSITFRWAGAGAVTPLAAESAVPPISPPLELPRWAGPGPPPPLVAGKYQPWEAPARSEPRR